ncbi:hypothetical protein HPB49_001378 [Dermacentor silvarum]|uniref:Uncharacterized protein n=1 Tax=Dermacentor silvarum TaxID=543639 RepID=A0ACB8D2B5_DERSI|nr:hypothetical protein HPB49_001378 [Dermacentor silvarum]
MLGNSQTAVITFEGKIVPRYVYYYGGETRCYLYRSSRQVCYICFKSGHRADVCPTPDAVVCSNCAEPVIEDGHYCEPRCVLCKEAHPTRAKECKERLRKPRSPRARKQEEPDAEARNTGGRGRTRKRWFCRDSSSTSRSRSRSRSASKTRQATETKKKQQKKTIAKKEEDSKARLTDWVAYRKTRAESEDAEITDITSWVAGIKADCKRLTREVALTTKTPEVDKHLLHLWDTRRGLLKRRKRQKHNRKLRLNIVEVTRQAEEYATELSGRNWDQKCNELQGTLGWKKIWALLMALIDPTMTKSENRKTTQRIAHGFQGTDRYCGGSDGDQQIAFMVTLGCSVGTHGERRCMPQRERARVKGEGERIRAPLAATGARSTRDSYGTPYALPCLAATASASPAKHGLFRADGGAASAEISFCVTTMCFLSLLSSIFPRAPVKRISTFLFNAKCSYAQKTTAEGTIQPDNAGIPSWRRAFVPTSQAIDSGQATEEIQNWTTRVQTRRCPTRTINKECNSTPRRAAELARGGMRQEALRSHAPSQRGRGRRLRRERALPSEYFLAHRFSRSLFVATSRCLAWHKAGAL